jgi:hypothetical protein
MAKSGAVESDHAVFFCGQSNQAAGFEVFDHAPVAMQQDQGNSRPSLNVVEANTFHGNEPPDGRVRTLSFFCKPPVQQGGRNAGHDNTGRDWKGLACHIGRSQGARSRLRKMHGDASGGARPPGSRGMLHCGTTASPAVRSCGQSQQSSPNGKFLPLRGRSDSKW